MFVHPREYRGKDKQWADRNEYIPLGNSGSGHRRIRKRRRHIRLNWSIPGIDRLYGNQRTSLSRSATGIRKGIKVVERSAPVTAKNTSDSTGCCSPASSESIPCSPSIMKSIRIRLRWQSSPTSLPTSLSSEKTKGRISLNSLSSA